MLREKQEMGKSNPIALQNAIWWGNNFFGLRGRDEHNKLRWTDISLQEDVNGNRFLQFQERDTKTRKTPENTRPFDPTIYETPEDPERCPIMM